MEYVAAQCAGDKPAAVDAESSVTTVYLRKDFVEITESQDGDIVTPAGWSYMEAKLTHSEYAAFMAKRNRDDLEFIAMMNDIELEENTEADDEQ